MNGDVWVGITALQAWRLSAFVLFRPVFTLLAADSAAVVW